MIEYLNLILRFFFSLNNEGQIEKPDLGHIIKESPFAATTRRSQKLGLMQKKQQLSSWPDVQTERVGLWVMGLIPELD